MAQAQQTQLEQSEPVVKAILATIERDREREIISRRFGLFDRRETLEQIGDLLGITRERVRQLEKAVLTRLRAAAEQGKLPHVDAIQTELLAELNAVGGAARISTLAAKLGDEDDRLINARLAFLARLCPALVVVGEDDHFYYSVGIKKLFDEKQLKSQVGKLIAAIKDTGEPKPITDIAPAAGITDAAQAAALASISKDLATLHGRWGLMKWPVVNPKNIRDKIYVILQEKGSHMHFNEIAEAIKNSNFKRKEVTTQAIHNELIKDKRFVLIGRGIYALKEWGYKKGTVADIIADVLKDANEPLHRDEIVKRVLKSRFVKETTILLNLQGKSQFKRVAKATYALAE